MNILAIGDVYGKAGCQCLLKKLPILKKEYKIDFVTANGENSAEGNGILPSSAEIMFAAGVDVITGGNHTLRRREIYDVLENNDFLLRPANFPSSVSGKGIAVVDLGYTQVAVINLLGVVYMESLSCPFETADKYINIAKAAGASFVRVINPLNLKQTVETYQKALNNDGVSVIIAKSPCTLIKGYPKKEPVKVIYDKCNNCDACVKELACPAISKVDGKIVVDTSMCNGCSMCVQVCKYDAFETIND